MSVDHPRDSLPNLIVSLRQNTREIDQTFAEAGDRLGRGLAIFEGLNDRLGAMSGELVGDDMDGTRTALLTVASNLRSFIVGLPDETKALEDIARHGDAASQSLDRLLDHIRLINAVSRSARIEAAQVSSGRQGSGFFDEIGALVDQAKKTIEGCAQDHNRLKALLASAIGSQRDFAASYGATLGSLADKLERTLNQIEERRRKSITLTEDAARQSRKIVDAVGGAIIALQCGDSTRQRLEHSLDALAAARDIANPGGAAAFSEDDRAALTIVLERLVAVQLRETAATMAEDVQQIDLALRTLAVDIAATTDLGRSLYGGDGNAGSASFLAVLEDELSQASSLFGKCNEARVQVDKVTEGLTAFINQFMQTAVSLSETVCNIVLIGLNSGLHASRLGNEGLGLVIIAHELKTTGDKIVADAGRLSPVFTRMQASMAEMKARESGGADRLVSLDGLIRQSLTWMKESGTRLQATLDGLAKDSTDVAGTVEDARRAFAGATVAGDAIVGAADILEDGRAPFSDGLAPNDRGALEDFLKQTIWPAYTMASERQLHITAVESFGLSAAA